MRVGLLVNPTAGRWKAARYHPGVAGILRRSGHLVVDLTAPDVESARVNAVSHLDELDALVVMGGDGVVQLGVNVVAGTAMPLGIIPVGSGNDNATGLGLPGDPREALRLILGQLRDAPGGVPTDAMRVTTSAGTTWAMATLNCGFDATVNERANQMTWPKSGLRYVRATLQSYVGYEPLRYALAGDDWTWEGDGLLVAVANIGYIGGGMHLAPDSVPDDGLLDVVIVDSSISKLDFLTFFPRVFNGSHVRHPAVQIRRTRRLEARASEPHVVYADGEHIGNLPLNVEVVPGAVRLFRPRTPLPRSARGPGGPSDPAAGS